MKIFVSLLLLSSLCIPAFAAVDDYQYIRVTATGTDAALFTGPSVLHTIVCWGADAAATAGDVAIRDSVAAGAGTILIQYQIAASLLLPQSSVLDVPFANGLFVDYTTTTDVSCTAAVKLAR
jgi:hypothetical protein